MIVVKVGDRDIEVHETQWGVRWDDGDVSPVHEGEDEARTLAADVTKVGGTAEVVAREVYVTAWAQA